METVYCRRFNYDICYNNVIEHHHFKLLCPSLIQGGCSAGKNTINLEVRRKEGKYINPYNSSV